MGGTRVGKMGAYDLCRLGICMFPILFGISRVNEYLLHIGGKCINDDICKGLKLSESP